MSFFSHTKTASIASEARKKRVEVVGTTWVIESIVCGEAAALDPFKVETTKA